MHVEQLDPRPISTVHHKQKAGEEKGNPDLQYASRFVQSYEPSGEEDAVEITECTGVAA
jgi:catechol O-methyltransferase